MLRWFDPDEPYSVRYGDLPHWWQIGVTTFVTFRTHDSVPAAVQRRIQDGRDRWLRDVTGSPPNASPVEMMRTLSPTQQAELQRRYSRAIEAALDRGHGACPLRRPDAAAVVTDSLHHFDGDRYELADFVVMPNHVHALIVPIQEHSPEAICRSWKRYTARVLNDLLGESGTFWQSESFDHLVRSAEHFEKYQRYVHANPRRAGLREDEYVLGCGRALTNPLP